MPTYEYGCSACGHRFDELQSFSAPPLTRCPRCQQEALVRLFGGGSAVIFKGSGFYETDYRRAASKPGTAAKEEAKKESASETPKGAEREGNLAGSTAGRSGGHGERTETTADG